jgi:hypothetical protein
VLHREHAWGGAGEGVDPCVVEVAAEELGPIDATGGTRASSMLAFRTVQQGNH